MPKQQWRSITDPGPKEDLLFATYTLGEEGDDWAWIKTGKLFQVGIPKNDYDRIQKKYERISQGKNPKGHQERQEYRKATKAT